MDSFIAQSALFGGLFAVVLAIGQLSHRNKTLKTYLLAGVMVSIGIILGSMYLNYSDSKWPHFFHYAFLPCLYFIGPSFYVYFFASVEKEFTIERKYIWLFLPSILFLVFLLLGQFGFSSLVTFDLYPLEYFDGKKIHWAEQSVTIAFILNFVYYIFIYIRARTVIKYSFLEKEPDVFFFLSVGWISAIVTAVVIYGMTARSLPAMQFATTAITLVLVYFFAVMQRNPQLFQELSIAIDTAKLNRYNKSQLANVDLKALRLELERLMTEDHLYRDESLSLARLSAGLNLTPHQLSEYLNKHLKKNFAQFVNHYRIEEAKEILRQEKDANILSLTYRVGFNSKSAFNVSFQKMTGMTPSEFRTAK